MKPGKLGVGQVIGVFLVGIAGITAVVVGLCILVRPGILHAALPPSPTLPVPQTLAPTRTPFQPLPSVTPTSPPPTTPPTPIPPTPEPEPTPTPAGPPANASIDPIIGYAQSYALSCESRSAVDWAHYFGVAIDETEFLLRLPLSDDPEVGFVGYYNDYSGQVPPYSYGVHAAPVAGLLRDYGLPANALKGLSLDELRAEIAAGRPVIVWIIYGVSAGYAIDYTASDGRTSVVAPNEHTVIVTGYDETSITVLDGAWTYQRSIDQFVSSWQVLGNMAVVYQPPEDQPEE